MVMLMVVEVEMEGVVVVVVVVGDNVEVVDVVRTRIVSNRNRSIL